MTQISLDIMIERHSKMYKEYKMKLSLRTVTSNRPAGYEQSVEPTVIYDPSNDFEMADSTEKTVVKWDRA